MKKKNMNIPCRWILAFSLLCASACMPSVHAAPDSGQTQGLSPEVMKYAQEYMPDELERYERQCANTKQQQEIMNKIAAEYAKMGQDHKQSASYREAAAQYEGSKRVENRYKDQLFAGWSKHLNEKNAGGVLDDAQKAAAAEAERLAAEKNKAATQQRYAVITPYGGNKPPAEPAKPKKLAPDFKLDAVQIAD